MIAATITTITRDEAMDLAAVEDARFLALVRSLRDDEWNAQTCCDGWDVRAMVAHVAGAAEGASVRELLHQFRLGRKVAKASGATMMVDGVNEVQIRERAHLTPAELVDRLEAAQPRFRRARRRLPAPLRVLRIPTDAEHGMLQLGRLVDVIYTRDTWMHGIDISRATGRAIELTPDHDGRIVADVVAEWAARHGRPFELVLTGPAGGTFTDRVDGVRIEMDAVDFCNVMAGRGSGTGLLETGVLF